MKRLLLPLFLILGLPVFAAENQETSPSPFQENSESTGAANISRESFDNPLVEIRTTMGSMILELFPDEAPLTVENFIGLAEGTKPFTDPETGETVTRPFYDGLIFHRVIEGFMIQGGSPAGDGLGGPGYSFRDEINARSLGLDKMPVLQPDGKPHPFLGIQDSNGFQREVMAPLYREMGIDSQEEVEERVDEIFERINTMTVKENYENKGYRYIETVISRAPVRGVIAMANSGPDTNGSQFFINLADTPWLTGKHTVFGKVRAGMDVLDAIGSVPVNAMNRPITEVSILSIRQIE